ncbi:MAG: hypothetical protein PHP44_06245 [Kiritimatiellae bacterium]|nr:hypothetical protein [Kiritimatiellia bacterium]MDD4735688.1 hypothetical protein [Kiritimatiellia bacterium]
MRRRMKFGWIWMLAALAVFPFTAQAEDAASSPCGVYDVQGWEPEGDTSSTPDYTGTTIISRRGEAYVFQGMLDDSSYEGIGWVEGGRLTFGYRGSDGDGGMIKGDNRNGVWVCQWVAMSQADGKPGRELWLRRKPVTALPDSASVDAPEVTE